MHSQTERVNKNLNLQLESFIQLMNSVKSEKATKRDPVQKTKEVVVVGLESVGKSSLLTGLTGHFAESSALQGTTLRCERYSDLDWDWVDTPGIITGSDALTMKDALSAMESAETVLIVLRSYAANEELSSLLPLLASKRIAVVLTFKDKLEWTESKEEQSLVAAWREKLQVPVVLLDTLSLKHSDHDDVRNAVVDARPLLNFDLEDLPKFQAKKKRTFLQKIEKALEFAPLSLLLLFGPAWIAVTQANSLADRFYDTVGSVLNPLLSWLESLPGPLSATLGGDYGVVAMFPFLLLYALPTILIFTGLVAIYKSTGLIDHLSYGLHPWLKPFGLGGRDLVRIVMGFGCNVPAVIATRSCSSSTRCTCVSAICFGSACSYQLPATLAVFSAVGLTWLSYLYLAVLALTTLIYLYMTKPPALRQKKNQMLLPELGHLRCPEAGAVIRDSFQTLRDFVVMAFPIFVGICLVAGLLQWSGVLTSLTGFLGPLMSIFNLPAEAALAIVLGSVRKDGLAIGLLNNDWDSLKIPLDSPIQVLTVVYLAGVLLPCLVTVFTVAKEMGPMFAVKMVSRQTLFASGFTLCIAWGGAFFF